MYGYGYDFGFFHFLTTVFWIAFIVLMIGWFRRTRMNHPGGRWGMPWGNTGMNVLNERYAKGEITKEEYEEKRKVLMGEK